MMKNLCAILMLACTCTVHAQDDTTFSQDPILIYQQAVDYLEGRGDAGQDYSRAVVLLEKLATDDWSVAQNRLGECFEQGLGVSRDLDRAMTWYQRAAELGHPIAQSNLKRLKKEQALTASGPTNTFY